MLGSSIIIYVRKYRYVTCASHASVFQNEIEVKENKQTYKQTVKTIKLEFTRLALIYALLFVYKGEQKNNVDKKIMLRDHFFGTEDIKGSAQQLIDDNGPFHHLYNTNENTNGEERILKHIYCRNAATMTFLVVGRDMISTLSDITTMSKLANGPLQHCEHM